jgi:hypothetical protein
MKTSIQRSHLGVRRATWRHCLVLAGWAVLAGPVFAGVDEGLKAYEDWDMATAARELLPLEGQGDRRVTAVLGAMYLHGMAVERNVSRGLELLREAAGQGDSRAQSVLGFAYMNGIGVPVDFEQAKTLFEKAAAQGYAGAYNNLGGLFWDGKGVPKDRAKAVGFVRKAAELGDPNAWYKLGSYYDFGSGGLQRDPVEAVRWYRKAAEFGIASAQNSLGVAYQNGDGVEKNSEQANAWFSKAASAGNAFAMANLGLAFQYGRAVDKNLQKAIELYRQAAIREHVSGQFYLANAYSNRHGDNPNPNYPLAYFWYLVMGNTTDSATVQKSSDGLTKMFHRVPSERRAEIEADMRKWSPGVPEPVYAVADAIAAPAPRPDSGPQASTGSGFRVNKDMVLTNQHVVENCKKLTVNDQPATVTASDGNADIALLSVKNLGGDVPQIRSEPARIGEDIAVAGFPLRGLLSGFNMTRGSVSSLSGIGGDTRLLQITAAVQPGNSGGPVVDGAGRVVGMVVSKLNWKTVTMTGAMPENVNFAINGNTLTSFLQAHQAGFAAISGPGKPLSPPDVADKVRTFAVLVHCSR